ncbi:MAG: response regulator transcription factor [Actinobacteria bacterium]|nr:response regulator transcription factor [Actinomycetota bacterium]
MQSSETGSTSGSRASPRPTTGACGRSPSHFIRFRRLASASDTVDENTSPRVLLVDDHALFRTGLRNLLEEQGVHIVGEADTGTEALKKIREVAPEVVVMDLNMPGISGVEATRQIAMIAPLTRVLVLTISDQDADVMDAILAGACGYLLKDSSIQELINGIRAASAGESLVSPAIASKMLQRLRATGASQHEAETIRSELSDRELQVLKLIANGKDNAQIAADLHISPKTVKNHISNILMKLQIENRIQAAVYAVRSGIV